MSNRKKNRGTRRQRTRQVASTLNMESLEVRNLLAADTCAACLDDQEENEPVEQVRADVNSDGVVSPSDAIMVLNAMLDDTAVEDDAAMDVNADGVLTPLDVLGVLNSMPRNNESVPGGDSAQLDQGDGAANRPGLRDSGGLPGNGQPGPGPGGGQGVDQGGPGGGPGGAGDHQEGPGGGPGGAGGDQGGPRGGPGGPRGNHGGPGGGPGGGQNDDRFVRTIDGTDNNLRNEQWGSTDEELLRISESEYGDGESSPAGEDRASAREISNLVAAQDESVENDRGLSDLLWQWGQFLDHDIDLTEGADPAEEFNIAVPTGDPYFDPLGTGEEVISLTRSVYDVDENGIRQQENGITAFIDGSNVYGSDEERAAAMRSFEGGKLLTSEGDLLPFNVDGLDNAGGTDDALFLAGDVRANEQIGLTAMHTLWVREHNRIADQLAEENPQATDEQLYQRARAIVIGEMQAITYNEFLPALLGEDAIAEYDGYDRAVNPGITNEFSTAAYRFGHSMLSTELLRLNNDGTEADEGNISLSDSFFSPSEIVDNGIDSLLLGQATQTAQEIDNMVVDDIRNFLFGPPGAGGFDLASLNIQRGRDHGLADYNQVRTDMGLDPVQSFADISSDPDVQVALEAAYGDVDSIDLWVGGLAEDHVAGASVGELVQVILVDQFTRLRDGDSFWYQEIFQGRELREIENTTLADVIERNTDIEGLQDNVFFAPTAERSLLAVGETVGAMAGVLGADQLAAVDGAIAETGGEAFNPSNNLDGLGRAGDEPRGRRRDDSWPDRTPDTRFAVLDSMFADVGDA